jgi:hypothetical protein
MNDNKQKLWVYDTYNYLEVYAPTLEEAEQKAYQIGKESGLTMILVDNWLEYQEDEKNERSV